MFLFLYMKESVVCEEKMTHILRVEKKKSPSHPLPANLHTFLLHSLSLTVRTHRQGSLDEDVYSLAS